MPIRLEIIYHRQLSEEEALAVPGLSHLVMIGNKHGKVPFFVVEYPFQWIPEEKLQIDINNICEFAVSNNIGCFGIVYGFETEGEKDKRYDQRGYSKFSIKIEDGIATMEDDNFQIGSEGSIIPYNLYSGSDDEEWNQSESSSSEEDQDWYDDETGKK